ncbi:MAG: Zinc transporter ZupT [Firmicutes bacterium ADurb.Bin193]|nr:MAG: Zinc transporter ZupT [Firmicutes bacterium ADurb.Bin193]
MDAKAVLFAFGLTLFAGLSTGIGSLIALLSKKTNKRFLSVTLGFSAGVMIYVSMIDIFAKAKNSLVAGLGVQRGNWAVVLSFFAGILLAAAIDRLVPSLGNPHELHTVEEMDESADKAQKNSKSLMRMGIMSALAIAIHNFPEGLATFTSSLSKPTLGIAIAIAVALHNIPEGLAVSIPVYFATGNRKKAFWMSFMSGLAEPAGALIGYLLFARFFNDITFGVLFAIVAGIMVFISLDELLPTAREYGEAHLTVYGLIGGMAVMAVSLLLFI